MGQCICREESRSGEGAPRRQSSADGRGEAPSPGPQPPSAVAVDRERGFPSHVIPASEAAQLRRMLPHIDSLVLQTLAVIGNLVEKYANLDTWSKLSHIMHVLLSNISSISVDWTICLWPAPLYLFLFFYKL